MNGKELIAFINRIVHSGDGDAIRLSLAEMRRVLQSEGATQELMTFLLDMMDGSEALATLHKKKNISLRDIYAVIYRN